MSDALTTTSILSAFSQEISEHGGKVSNLFHDQLGGRLFVRSTLPQSGDVKAKDRVQGGVALKAHGSQVSIYPYVFRLVCQNGAIMAQALASRRVSAMFDFDPERAVTEIREAVAMCCEPSVFTASLNGIRGVVDAHADMALNLLPMLSRVPSGLMDRIMERFFRDGDESPFGFMNAITSVARDTADPETKWNLEELGGGIAVAAPVTMPKTPPARAVRRRELELVS
jgi:hypothetical protein